MLQGCVACGIPFLSAVDKKIPSKFITMDYIIFYNWNLSYFIVPHLVDFFNNNHGQQRQCKHNTLRIF